MRVVDLALGPGTLAAMKAGLIPMQGCVAPEVQASGTADRASAMSTRVGALMYEASSARRSSAVGRGRARSSQGVGPQIDELVARACHRDPESGSAASTCSARSSSEASSARAGATVPIARSPPTRRLRRRSPMQARSRPSRQSAARVGQLVVDRALAAALADTTEKWLVSKGSLDYGPFSLADVVKQIEKGEIVAGNMIMDKDTGARVDVGEHPLLGPIVDAARQRLDDQRRAQAEVKVQSRREEARRAALRA